MSSESQALVQMESQFASLSLYREPKEVLAEAAKAANSIKEVIDKKPNKVIFNGEVYLENEDWLTIARFYGVTVRTKSTTYVEFGAVHGWESEAEAFLVATGQVIGKADAMCLNDEENWGNRPKYEWVDELDAEGNKIWLKNKAGKNYTKGSRKLVGHVPVPLFQLRSMAQTRASSKVCSMLFKWVVVLAGFKPTPAEEVDQTTIDASQSQQEEPQQSIKRPERKKPESNGQEAKVEAPRDPDCISEAQQKMLYAVSRQCKLADVEIKAKLQAEFKDKSGQPLQHSKDMLKKDFQSFLASVDPGNKFHQASG